MSKVTEFRTLVSPGLRTLESDSRILTAFSRREDGGMSMNRGDESECLARRELFFSKLNWKLERTVWCELVHGTKIVTVTETDAGKGAFTKKDALFQTDGIWTSTPRIMLCTTHADCLPLYYFIPSIPAVGVAHCGWRGIADALPVKMVQHAINEFGVNANDILIGIGPGIRVECFEIGEELLDRFPSNTVVHQNNKWFVDLPEVVKSQLISFGILPGKIEDSGLCSKCTPLFSSFRRDRNEVAPAVACIAIR